MKVYSSCELIFGRHIITLIKKITDWELIRHQNQTQVNKYNIRENGKTVEHAYTVRDKFMLANNVAFKYETSYNLR